MSANGNKGGEAEAKIISHRSLSIQLSKGPSFSFLVRNKTGPRFVHGPARCSPVLCCPCTARARGPNLRCRSNPNVFQMNLVFCRGSGEEGRIDLRLSIHCRQFSCRGARFDPFHVCRLQVMRVPSSSLLHIGVLKGRHRAKFSLFPTFYPALVSGWSVGR